MRTLSKIVFVVALVTAASPLFAEATVPSITVEQPYARATPAGAATGAVYMTLIKAKTADRLTAASSDIAAKLQIHEMAVTNGIMQMRELKDGLPVPADGSVVLKPGSYHVMLIGLKKALTAGETLPLTLTFEKAGNISVTVPVQAMDATKDNTSGGTSGTSGGMSGMGGTGGGTGHMEMK